MNPQPVFGPPGCLRRSAATARGVPVALHAVAFAVLALSSPTLLAGAQTDGTAGPVRTLSGQFTVPQALGTLNGSNLFHSFQRFSVNPQESATFSTTTASVQNVIARVTGGAASTVEGLLRLDAAGGGRPALFLINPAGITLGAGSRVDVPGAFHLSTANYLKLADGSVFQTDLGKGGSSFSAAAPQAFGFVGAGAGSIVLADNAALGSTGFVFTGGPAVSLSGADVTIRTSVLSTGGSVRVAAVGSSAAEVGLTGSLPPLSGRLLIDNGALVGTSSLQSTAAGDVSISAGEIVIGSPDGTPGGGIVSLAPGAEVGGGIRIDAALDMTLRNGGSVTSSTDQSSRGGNVSVKVGGKLQVEGAGGISTSTTSSGNAGSVDVAVAGSIVLDGSGSAVGAFIGSETAGSGSSGMVSVSAGAGLSLIDGGRITSSTFGAGSGGAVKIEAASILVDNQVAPRGTGTGTGTGIASNSTGAGHAGSVEVRATGELKVDNGGTITSSTNGRGQAGGVVVRAGSIVLDGRGGAVTGIVSETGGAGNAGPVSVSADAGITIRDTARISSSSFESGNAGSVTVATATLRIEGARSGMEATGIQSTSRASGDAGTVDVSVSGLAAITNGQITASTEVRGRGGAVTVQAGSIVLDGQAGAATAIASETGGAGNAGRVSVSAVEGITIRDARISSSSFDSGNAGNVTVGSATLSIEGAESGAGPSGIQSISRASGDAGTVDVSVSGLAAITGGLISTSSVGSGRGGAVTVQAGSIVIGSTEGRSGAGITANAFGTGNAGSLSVAAVTSLSILNGGNISSSTFGDGAGGSVSVSAGSLLMDGRGSSLGASITSETAGSGSGGPVKVTVRDHLAIFDQATISSSAFATGRGGQVQVRAGSAELDNAGGKTRSGIGSVAFSGSGDAGGVDVRISGALSLSNGAEVSADTSTTGAAGAVHVSAETLVLSGGASINSGANAASSGRIGDVTVVAARDLRLTDDARLSIRNDATVAAPESVAGGTLSVTAPRIELARAEITASSTGNIAAGSIVIEQRDRLVARERSAINTSAASGRGGSIVLRGGGALLLDHSRLTTSVTGTSNGDGGPIAIESPLIVLDSGFIQANTAVADARGGDVTINAVAPGILIASRQQLITGGRPVAHGAAGNGPNVIQAARPDGVNGDLRIASPQVDLSGSLASLLVPRIDFDALGADMCRIEDGSSLTPVGRGALRPSYAEPVRPSR